MLVVSELIVCEMHLFVVCYNVFTGDEVTLCASDWFWKKVVNYRVTRPRRSKVIMFIRGERV